MKKVLAMLLALTMVLSLGTLALAANDSVTLNVVTSYGGDDGNRANFEAAVRAYEEATGNKVNDGSATSNEEWKAKVLTDFETGSEPDVLFFFTNADAEPFISAGKVVSIDEIRAEYPDYATNMKSSMMAVAADGKQYSVPSSGYWENMFVNKAVLADCGIEVPHYWFEFMVMNNGTVENHLELPQSPDDAVAAKWAAALEDIKALYEAGYFPANTLTASDAETVELFNAGEAAFLIDGSWKVGYFTANAADLNDFAISYVPAKGERSASEAIGGISMGYFITRKAWDDPAKREAAVAFVSLLTSDEVMSTFVTTEVTALVNGASPAGLNALQQSAAEANANITAIAGAVQDSLTAEARGDLFANVQNVVTGKMTAEEAIASALALN